MALPADPAHHAKPLALAVLAGTVALLVLLVAIPLVVPHENLPEPIIVFVSIFILIAALIAGIALAYLFLARAPAAPATPEPAANRGAGDSGGSPEPAMRNLAIRLLDGDERRLLKIIVEAKGEILQRDLVRITAFSEAKVSRLLDRLEERGLVRRERRGMANRVRLTLDPP